MANTVHGPFAKGATTSTGSYGTGVGQSNTYTSGNANNDETQSAVALHSFNPDLITAGFVLSGVTCAKDGTTASQLDVASGYAYLVMTDGTNARCDVATTTFSSSGHATSTLYLDLNPDGTWSWGTSHSGQANYLTICTVTTDGSSNILTVTDTRNLNPALMSGMAGVFTHLLAKELSAKTALGGSTQTLLELWATDNHYWAVQQDTGGDLLFLDSTSGHTWTFGGTGTTLLPGGVVVGAGAAITGAISSLGGQTSAGSFGAPVVVAQALSTHVTSTATQNIIIFTSGASAGFYRASLYFYLGNTSNAAVQAGVSWSDPNNSSGYGASFVVSQNPAASTPLVTGTANTLTKAYGYACIPLTFAHGASSSIAISYTDPTGSPNDYVSAVIERLA